MLAQHHSYVHECVAPTPAGTVNSKASAAADGSTISPSASNPILAMLGGEDDDDEFLKGLAPPKKDAAGNITSSSSAATGTGSTAGASIHA
jgi:hypothetical protein